MTPRIVGGELTATSYADVSSMLTALGSSYEGQVRLISKTTGLTIGRWAYVGTAITPIGPIRFDRVTATPCGSVASASGTTIVLTAGHSVTALSRVLRWQDVTAGTWADVPAGSWSISGNNITAPAATVTAIAAALAGGNTVRVHLEDVSELCIGGSTCEVNPRAGSTALFASGLLAGPEVAVSLIAWASGRGVRATVGAWAGGANGNFVGVGWSKTGAAISSLTGVNVSLEKRQGVYLGTYPGSIVNDTSVIGLLQVCTKADGNVQFSCQHKQIASGASSLTTTPYTEAQLAGCIATLRSSPTARFDRIEQV